MKFIKWKKNTSKFTWKIIKFYLLIYFSAENIEDFARDVANNNLKEYIKSAPIPLNNDNRLVKMVVGETFHEMVNDENKDVLIHFHSANCYDCESLSLKLDKLASLVNIMYFYVKNY